MQCSLMNSIYFVVIMEQIGSRLGRQIQTSIRFIPIPLMILMYSIKLYVLTYNAILENRLNYWV